MKTGMNMSKICSSWKSILFLFLCLVGLNYSINLMFSDQLFKHRISTTFAEFEFKHNWRARWLCNYLIKSSVRNYYLLTTRTTI